MYLNLWCLFCALAGTAVLDRIGRKPLALVSTAALTVLIFIYGALSKGKYTHPRFFVCLFGRQSAYQGCEPVYGSSENRSAIIGVVAVLFLFQGAYSLAWTPLAMVYPPEILSNPLRSVGMGIYGFWTNAFG